MTGVARRLSLLTPVLAALALGACGGTSTEDKNAYVREVNAAQTEFASTVTTVSQAITPKSSASQDRRTLRQFETAIKDVIADLERVDVPTDVEPEHKQLVGAMSSFGDDISEANDALRDPTTRTLEQAQRRIATATETVNGRIDAAIAAINKKLGAKT